MKSKLTQVHPGFSITLEEVLAVCANTRPTRIPYTDEECPKMSFVEVAFRTVNNSLMIPVDTHAAADELADKIKSLVNAHHEEWEKATVTPLLIQGEAIAPCCKYSPSESDAAIKGMRVKMDEYMRTIEILKLSKMGLEINIASLAKLASDRGLRIEELENREFDEDTKLVSMAVAATTLRTALMGMMSIESESEIEKQEEFITSGLGAPDPEAVSSALAAIKALRETAWIKAPGTAAR